MILFHRCFSHILLVKPNNWFFHKWNIGLIWVKNKSIYMTMYKKDIPFCLNILRHDILYMLGYTVIHVYGMYTNLTHIGWCKSCICIKQLLSNFQVLLACPSWLVSACSLLTSIPNLSYLIQNRYHTIRKEKQI